MIYIHTHIYINEKMNRKRDKTAHIHMPTRTQSTIKYL